MVNERVPSDACAAYARSVYRRENDRPMPAEAYCFTNDFDKAMRFKAELAKLIPDLDTVLSVMEVDALIDFVYDKTCEDLRKKGFLSEGSKAALLR